MKFPILYVQLAWLTAAATAAPQEGRGDASDNGASCKAFKHWDCADPPRVDEVELLDLGDLSLEDAPARRLRLRDVDFSDVDEKTGFNVTELIRRESAIETDDKTLHSKILRLLSDPEVVGDNSEVANLYYKRQADDENSGDDSDNDNKFDANKPDKVFADNSAGPGSSHTYDMCTPKISYKVQGYEGTTDLYDLENWGDCKNFNIVYKKNTINNRNGLRTYIREHILEKQMLQIFINQKFKNQKGSPVPSYDANSIKSHCHYLQRFWEGKATALRMTILVGKYMDNGGISAIYKAQAQRVAVKLNEVEDALVVNWQGSETEYERLDLSGKWLQFIEEWTDRTNKKLEDFLLKYLPRAKELIKEADEKAAELKKEKKELPKDDKDLLDTLRATVEEIERTTGPNKPKALFKNPFRKTDRQEGDHGFTS
ncbi:hypothetical protein VD0002_g2902 [Verticillium dahliae]|uniref:Uncharacterized protein n=1 Tax=Verticillium dahliae TaxID=27337 RepID=A0AA44W9K8_VERDA|nr:hypothetical protein BJF96_g10289 [Verticillium dahliae]PNH52710.1 hypothetical protein VD0003_g4654 [Verticillium dahliae]PNH66473.1 hypothetical protein VD0002_g2902 [Verticillium dahliae]